jgi:flavin-dependent dehydrogenase
MSIATDHNEPLADEYDVVVVGARCAGAATALLLARAGLSVLAVERSGYGADTLSTHALTKPGVLQLSRWGVLDAVRRAGTPKVDTVAYHYGDEQVAIPIKPDGDVDGLYAPRRTVLDRVLVDAAVEAGATVAHRTAVADLIVDHDDRVRGVVIDSNGTVMAVRSRLVIGADGARSFVARSVGASIEHSVDASSATVYAFVPGLPDNTYRNYFEPAMAAGVIPTNDGEANVWVSASAERFKREARANPTGFFHHLLHQADPSLESHVSRHPPHRIRSFAGLNGFTRTAWGPGWALVGDAVYFKDPVSAHGMTDALIGAELLARHVTAIFHGTDEAESLSRYSAARTSLAVPMTDAVARLATYAWHPEEVKQMHLEMNHAMRNEWTTLHSLDAMSPTADERVAAAA